MNKDWKKEFRKKYKVEAVPDMFAVIVINCAMPENLEDYIQSLLDQKDKKWKDKIENIIEKHKTDSANLFGEAILIKDITNNLNK